MEPYVNDLIAFAQANPAIAGAVGLVLLYMVIRQTKLFLFLLLLASVLAGVFSVIGEMSGKSTARKQEILRRTDLKDVK